MLELTPGVGGQDCGTRHCSFYFESLLLPTRCDSVCQLKLLHPEVLWAIRSQLASPAGPAECEACGALAALGRVHWVCRLKNLDDLMLRCACCVNEAPAEEAHIEYCRTAQLL